MTAKSPAEFFITRIFDGPRERVWKAFTESERLMHWWGPKGFTMQVSKLDLRPGGVFHYGMRSPDGRVMWGKFVYREIVAPERLVVSFTDEEGNPVRRPMSPTWREHQNARNARSGDLRCGESLWKNPSATITSANAVLFKKPELLSRIPSHRRCTRRSTF